MEHDVVVEERLLDKQQIEAVELLEHLPALQVVGRVGIDLEHDVGVGVAQRLDDLHIESRPDLHLQAGKAHATAFSARARTSSTLVPPMLTPTGKFSLVPPQNSHKGFWPRCASR